MPLPSLPSGCEYKDVNGGFSVECTNSISTNRLPPDLKISIPPIPSIAVPLPQLPSHCQYENTTNGISVNCPAPSGTEVALPSLPQGCVYKQASQGNISVKCVNQITIPPIPSVAIPTITIPPFPTIKVALPTLPANCRYETTEKGTVVKCAPPVISVVSSPAPSPAIEPTTVSGQSLDQSGNEMQPNKRRLHK